VKSYSLTYRSYSEEKEIRKNADDESDRESELTDVCKNLSGRYFTSLKNSDGSRNIFYHMKRSERDKGKLFRHLKMIEISLDEYNFSSLKN